MNTDRLKVKALTVGENPEWVEGYYYYRPDNEDYNHWLSMVPWYYKPVQLNTLCQCTGLKDSNGDLIYEGDELECNFRHGVDKVGFVDAALSLHTGFVLRFPEEGGTHTHYVHMGGSNVLSITLTGKNIHDPNQ